MKNARIIAFLISSSLFGLLLSNANAETTWFGHKAAGQWFVGAKAGTVQNGSSDFSDANNGGIILGYEFARAIAYRGRSSIELDLTTSFDDGDIGFDSDFGAKGDWDVDTIGIFFAYRTPGTVYFKGKLGGLHSEVTQNVGLIRDKDSDTSFAAGAALGLLVGDRGNIELEYTGTSGDNDLSIFSLGGFVRF